MPQNKDLKRLVRARMRKTGEAYTAARAHIANKPTTKAPTGISADIAAATTPKALDYAALAGMSDEKVKAKTGCTWERWARSLDHHRADQMSHGEIADLIKTKYKVGPWWTQTITVGYERIKGLRKRGQQRNGTYQMTKSRTFAVPVTALFDAWAKPAVRRRWLNGERVKVRSATAPRSMRLDWADGGIVAVGFAAKGRGKSSVAVEHTKLPDRTTADRLKGYWGERFDALRAVLTDTVKQ